MNLRWTQTPNYLISCFTSCIFLFYLSLMVCWSLWYSDSFLCLLRTTINSYLSLLTQLSRNFLGVEVGVNGGKNKSAIARSAIMILPPNIWWIIGPVFLWMTRGWIIPTLVQHKIITINSIFNSSGDNCIHPKLLLVAQIRLLIIILWVITISLIL